LKLLLVDTSTDTCSAALVEGERILAERVVSIRKVLSGQVLGTVEGVLGDGGVGLDEVDGIALAIGPGSFTGLRVGAATVKGLALAAEKPAAGFSSLAMLAMNLPWAAFSVCPMLDARKNEVYAGLYRCRELPEVILPDLVEPPEQFLQRIEGPTLFLGSGALRYRNLIENTLGLNALFPPFQCHQPRVSAAALLAHDAFVNGRTLSLPQLNPVYLRASEAEIAKNRKQKQPTLY
jgi:tRNA threonylcarbamoyladenosine biosynthesis protein TsaB